METGELEMAWFSQAMQGQEWYFINNNEKPKAQHDLSKCYTYTRKLLTVKQEQKNKEGGLNYCNHSSTMIMQL